MNKGVNNIHKGASILRNKILIFFGVITAAVFCFCSISAFAGGNPDIDFNTAEGTIRTYYNNFNDRKIVSKCFFPSGFTGKVGKFWSNYKIVNKIKTTKSGETTHSGVIISEKAVEITVAVEMVNTKRSNAETKFWYLLQEINGKWKIIEYSHISNSQYPSYD